MSEDADALEEDGQLVSSALSHRFDAVFSPGDDTRRVFDSSFVQSIVKPTLDGYNGTLFAYGQTSAGKTYTLLGDERNPGLDALCAAFLFDSVEGARERGSLSEYFFHVCYIEIYNETLRDLLEPANTNIRLVEDRERGVVARGRKQVVVHSADDVLQQLLLGERNRHFGSTAMNERSSRSHTVLSIAIEIVRGGKEEERDAGCVHEGSGCENEGSECTSARVSTLNLVDLAGSERVKRSGATGERFEEAKEINKSLSVLGLVISRLAERASNEQSISHTTHIPFRDSKLTRLLQTSLGGNAHTGCLCCISPTGASLAETRTTLAFAARAKLVRQRARVNELVSTETLLHRYKLEIAKLKRQLTDAQQEAMSSREHLREGISHSSQHEEIRMNVQPLPPPPPPPPPPIVEGAESREFSIEGRLEHSYGQDDGAKAHVLHISQHQLRDELMHSRRREENISERLRELAEFVAASGESGFLSTEIAHDLGCIARGHRRADSLLNEHHYPSVWVSGEQEDFDDDCDSVGERQRKCGRMSQSSARAMKQISRMNRRVSRARGDTVEDDEYEDVVALDFGSVDDEGENSTVGQNGEADGGLDDTVARRSRGASFSFYEGTGRTELTPPVKRRLSRSTSTGVSSPLSPMLCSEETKNLGADETAEVEMLRAKVAEYSASAIRMKSERDQLQAKLDAEREAWIMLLERERHAWRKRLATECKESQIAQTERAALSAELQECTLLLEQVHTSNSRRSLCPKSRCKSHSAIAFRNSFVQQHTLVNIKIPSALP